MNANRDNLIAYLGTLTVIAVLTLAAAAVCIFCQVNTEVSLARILGALAFISASITGLIGVIGTFKPKSTDTAGNTQADANLATMIDKIPPVTTGTGPAAPLDQGA